MLEEISATQVESTRQAQGDGEVDKTSLEDDTEAHAHGSVGEQPARIWTIDVDMDD